MHIDMLWSSLPWSDIFVLYMYLFVCILQNWIGHLQNWCSILGVGIFTYEFLSPSKLPYFLVLPLSNELPPYLSLACWSLRFSCRTLYSSSWLCWVMRTLSAEVMHPLQAKQSFSVICAFCSFFSSPLCVMSIASVIII